MEIPQEAALWPNEITGYGRRLFGEQTETALRWQKGEISSLREALTLPIRQVVVPKDCSSLLGLDTKVPLVTVPSSVSEINIILN